MQDRLKKLRENLGLTQEEMAAIIGLCSANAYSLKERGERRFTLNEARAVSQYFKLPIEEIFFSNDLTNRVNKKPTKKKSQVN